MNRAALALTLVAASSGLASAGGYVGLGIGTAPAVDSHEGPAMAPDGRSVRIIGGSRFGRFSVEGAIGGFDAVFDSQGGRYGASMYQASISGKFNLPLSDGFEAYGRLGLQRTWLNMKDDRFSGKGDGLMLGVGMEYKLNVGLASSSLWVDYQYTSAALDGEIYDFDFSARMWTLGATIGF